MGLILLVLASPQGGEVQAGKNRCKQGLCFTANADGGFTFNTSALRGRLRAQGKSLGLTEVEHVASRTRLDRSNGLLSHYRVFSKGVRYGGGAWDWPSQAVLLTNGAVAVEWPSAEGRSFTMKAVYTWFAPDTIDVETSVQAHQRLEGFESFLASYANQGFTNAWACAAEASPKGRSDRFVRASPSLGDWLAFPRDEESVSVFRDGRWLLEPNPVDWKLQARLTKPLAVRYSPKNRLGMVFMGQPKSCFAISMPHELETHYSTYLSLFGQTLEPGQTVKAKTRLVIRTGRPLAEALTMYSMFVP